MDPKAAPKTPADKSPDKETPSSASPVKPGYVNQVVIDGMVILQIIKHSSDIHSEMISGILTGFATQDAVEISNCFPTPADFPNAAESGIYIQHCFERLGGSDYEPTPVGIYASTRYSDFITDKIINTLVENQRATDKFVFIVYDPVQTALVFFSSIVHLLYFFGSLCTLFHREHLV
jgi:hypothetical protein